MCAEALCHIGEERHWQCIGTPSKEKPTRQTRDSSLERRGEAALLYNPPLSRARLRALQRALRMALQPEAASSQGVPWVGLGVIGAAMFGMLLLRLYALSPRARVKSGRLAKVL